MVLLEWTAGYLVALAWAASGAWILWEVGPPLLLSAWWVAAPAAFWTFARRRGIHLRHPLLGGLSCGSRVMAVYTITWGLIVLLNLWVLALLLMSPPAWVLLVVGPVIWFTPCTRPRGSPRVASRGGFSMTVPGEGR